MLANRDKGMPQSRTRIYLVACLSLLLTVLATAPSPSLADDMDRVRELRSTDSILPLSQILILVEKQYPGTLLEVELEEEKGKVIYEMELLGKDKVVHRIKVNARSGNIIFVDKED